LHLLEAGDLLTLGALAHNMRWRLHPEPEVSFVIDRNINYTDGCVTGFRFSSGPQGHPGRKATAW